MLRWLIIIHLFLKSDLPTIEEKNSIYSKRDFLIARVHDLARFILAWNQTDIIERCLAKMLPEITADDSW